MQSTKHGSRPTATVARMLALPLTVVLGCAPAGEAPGRGEPAPPAGGVDINVAARHAAPGAQVQVEAEGFAPNSTIVIGFGPPRAEYSEIERVQTDARGRVSATVEVPSWAETGRPYVFVAADTDSRPKAISDPILVAASGERVTLEGTLSGEGVECPAMRGPLETLYTLAGAELEGLQAGDRVTITGTVAEASICMQGITIEVQSVQKR